MHCIISGSNCPPKFQPDLICKIQENLIKTEGYADNKVKNRHLQESRGRNSKINNQIWTLFEFVQDFTHVHLICKFQDDPIKTE